MIYRLKNTTGMILLLMGIYLCGVSIYESWDHFMQVCPNKDVLSWDANLRFNTVADHYQNILQGDFLSPIYYTFKSPTWPALRSNIALFVFFISSSGPDTILDVKISLFFYILLFPLLFWFCYDLTRDLFKASIIWLFISQMILHTRQFSAYALSSMLETQGMVFMLLTSYFLYKVYEYQRAVLFSGDSHQINSSEPSKWLWIGLLFASQGLFHTKYPYGLMLVISLILYESFRQSTKLIEFLQLILLNHYKGLRKIFLFICLFCVLSFMALLLISKFPEFQNLSEILGSKTLKNSIWLLSLVIFIDFNYGIYKFRFEFRQLFDHAFRFIYLFVVAPIVFWLLLHPDRMGSIVGTQQHTQEASRSFFVSFFGYVFDRPEPLLILGLLCIPALIIFYKGFIVRMGLRVAIRDVLHHPLSALIFIILMQILILEKLTGNKQLRHIYHLVPVILLLMAVIVIRMPKGLGSPRKPRPLLFFVLSRTGYGILPLSLLFFIQPFENSYLSAQSGFLQSIHNYSYVNQRLLCFTGYNKEIYDPVRELVQKIPVQEDIVLVNTLHNPMLMEPQRALATEFDLLLRMKGLKNNANVRNDNVWDVRDWNDFERLLIIEADCKSDVYELNANERAKILKVSIQPDHIYRLDQNKLCVKSYKIRTK